MISDISASLLLTGAVYLLPPPVSASKENPGKQFVVWASPATVARGKT